MIIYDCHTHLVNWQTQQSGVNFNGHKISGRELRSLAALADDIDDTLDVLQGMYNNMFNDDLNYKPLIQGYLNNAFIGARNLLKRMDESGIDKAVVLMVPQTSFKDSALAASAILRACKKANFRAGKERLVPFYGWSFELLKHQNANLARGFKGLKFYPKIWGFYNSTLIRRALRTGLNYARENVLSCTAHVSPGGIGCGHFPPSELWPLLDDFRDVPYCMAHGGGQFTDWTYEIIDNIERRELGNLFIDIAFHDNVFTDKNYQRKIVDIIDRIPANILFGSDWPLHTIKYSLKEFAEKVKNLIGQWNFELITNCNPERFLGVSDE
jgi:predicted TIM-barrel fold metal-dependent hydrolase